MESPIFPPIDRTCTRRALLIGINYTGTSGELHGCVNDVRKMSSFLLERGWASESIVCLTDDSYSKYGKTTPPTKRNILAAMRWLVSGAKAGDVSSREPPAPAHHPPQRTHTPARRPPQRTPV